MGRLVHGRAYEFLPVVILVGTVRRFRGCYKWADSAWTLQKFTNMHPLDLEVQGISGPSVSL